MLMHRSFSVRALYALSIAQIWWIGVSTKWLWLIVLLITPSSLVWLITSNCWSLVFDGYQNLSRFFFSFKNLNIFTDGLIRIGHPFTEIDCSLSIKIIFSNIIIIDLDFQFIGISLECEIFIPFWLFTGSIVRFGLELLSTNVDNAIRILDLNKIVLLCQRDHYLQLIQHWRV